MSTPTAQLYRPEAPQLYRVFRRVGAALQEAGCATGRSVIEALRLFDGRASWQDCQVGPYRFTGHGCDYLLEPVFLRRHLRAPRAGRRKFYVTVTELRQRGLLQP